MIKIAIDTLGGDLSPDANIEGALAALKKLTDMETASFRTRFTIKNA